MADTYPSCGFGQAGFYQVPFHDRVARADYRSVTVEFPRQFRVIHGGEHPGKGAGFYLGKRFFDELGNILKTSFIFPCLNRSIMRMSHR